MTSRFWLLGSLALLPVLPIPAAAAGAWATFLKAQDFTDLIASPDEVWCATGEAGLLRLDRATGIFEEIRREPGSISSNNLSCLAFDRSGRLWVGTQGRGVSRLTADRRSWELVNVFDGLPVDSVNAIEADRDTMWIGTTRGIALWNGAEISGSLPDGNTVSFDTTFPIPSITGIVVRGDSLWLASRRGIGVGLISSGLSIWSPENDSLTNLEIEHLASDGITLFCHAAGAVYRLRDLGSWEAAGPPGIVHSLIDDLGQVLAGTEVGVYRWDGTGWIQIPGAPRAAVGGGDDPEPTVDASGKHFVGTPAGLFEELAPSSWMTHAVPGPPSNNLINVLVDGTRVYVNSVSEGVARYDANGWRAWAPVACQTGCDTTFVNPIFSFGMMADKHGKKWIGCWDQTVDRFDDTVSPPQVRHYHTGFSLPARRHTWVWAAALDSTPNGPGGRWLGLNTPLLGEPGYDAIGLDYYSGDNPDSARNFNVTNSDMTGSVVQAVTVDRVGKVWVGYKGQGIDYFLPPAPAEALNATQVSGTGTLDIRGLAAYGDSVWALTASQLRRYSTGALLRRTLSVPSGQADIAIQPIDVTPDGSVWIGTVDGVYAFYRDGRTENFNVSNSPLAANEVRAVRVDRVTGQVWIATAEGLNRYDPNYVPPPPPEVDRLSIRVYPNPATLNGLGVPLRLSGNAGAYGGEIYDLSGRLVYRFKPSADGRVFWDGRDQNGALVKPGIYFVRAEASGREAFARIVLLR